ncbi:Acetyl-coenzyme A carboxylase carboxyl transferase subunit alpha [compost metagenome]
MKITAKDLLEFGIIEEIIAEPQGGAHKDLEQQAEQIKEKLWKHLEELLPLSSEQLVEDRYQKFRKVGQFKFVQSEQELPEAAANDGTVEAVKAADPVKEETAEAAPTGQ